jgi:hypothetical protein
MGFCYNLNQVKRNLENIESKTDARRSIERNLNDALCGDSAAAIFILIFLLILS